MIVLAGLRHGIEPPFVEECGQPSFNYHTIRVKDSRLSRNKLREYLRSRAIHTMVYYPLSLHLQEAYEALGYKQGDFPESERAQEEVLSLPMYPELSQEQVQEVVAAIKEFIEKIDEKSQVRRRCTRVIS